MSRRPSVATSLCMRRAVSTPVKDRGKRHPKLHDALTATAKPMFCTPKLGQPQIRRTIFRSLEVLVGENLELAPDGDDVRLRRDELCHSQLARPDRHERTQTDDELTVVTLWPREALHTSSTTCCPVCQKCDRRWALRSQPLPSTLHQDPSLPSL